MPFRVIARFVAKPGREAEVRALLAAMIAPTHAEPGEKVYDLFQGDDPCRFFFIEAWADRAAFEFHKTTPHFVALGPKLDGLLEGSVELNFVTQVAA